NVAGTSNFAMLRTKLFIPRSHPVWVWIRRATHTAIPRCENAGRIGGRRFAVLGDDESALRRVRTLSVIARKKVVSLALHIGISNDERQVVDIDVIHTVLHGKHVEAMWIGEVRRGRGVTSRGR